MAENLVRMGARIRELPDGWEITGPTPLRGSLVETRGDHRLVMAMAVAGCLAEGPTLLDDVSSVGISFPDFFDRLAELGGRGSPA